MAGYQYTIIIGNVGREPELRYTQSGVAVCDFSVAVNRTWSDRNTSEKREETTWFRVSTWGRQAETANEYLKKGSQVLVEGRLKPDPTTGSPRLWTRQDGTVAASFEIQADLVRFIGGRDRDGAGESDGDGSGFHSGDPAATEEDDIPF